jgi:hypothetical protein
MGHASMTSALQGARAPRSRQPATRLAIIVALFLTILSLEWSLGHVHFFDAPSPPAPSFSGTGIIQLAPDGQALCERRRLDNRSGIIVSEGLVRCDEIGSTPSAPIGDVQRRMLAIREHFNPSAGR